jgi:predicted O-linked N-acetylglucosamine transferase (SPINDLY family)
LPKINASVIEVWSRILKGVANSRIIIKSLTGLEYMPTRQKMLELFAANGITEDRVILHGGIQSAAEHLATYHEIDIGLDTFPYNGTTTTCEAMWMGAPVVALEGKTHAGRVGVSLLSNLGLGELIGRSVDEYVEIAGRLASDLGGLGRMRAGLRQKMRGSPLLDGRQFARDVEAAYRRLWVRWIET